MEKLTLNRYELIDWAVDKLKKNSRQCPKRSGDDAKWKVGALAAQRRRLVANVKQTKDVTPLLVSREVDADGFRTIIDGDGRWHVLMYLGEETAQCLVNHGDVNHDFIRHNASQLPFRGRDYFYAAAVSASEVGYFGGPGTEEIPSNQMAQIKRIVDYRNVDAVIRMGMSGEYSPHAVEQVDTLCKLLDDNGFNLVDKIADEKVGSVSREKICIWVFTHKVQRNIRYLAALEKDSDLKKSELSKVFSAVRTLTDWKPNW